MAEQQTCPKCGCRPSALDGTTIFAQLCVECFSWCINEPISVLVPDLLTLLRDLRKELKQVQDSMLKEADRFAGLPLHEYWMDDPSEA